MSTETIKTEVGSYFIANYPPFSQWTTDAVAEARAAFAVRRQPMCPLGLYLHIPFCRKRCKFCYFRVYTDKNARDVETYVDALSREIELYQPQAGGRRPAVALRLFRRRHAVVSERRAASRRCVHRLQAIFPGTRPRKSPSNASRARCSSTSWPR